MPPKKGKRAESEDDEEIDDNMANSRLALADPVETLNCDKALEKPIKEAYKKYKELKSKKPKLLRVGDTNIFPVQYVMAEASLAVTGNIVWHAKRGFGKTLTAIYLMLQCQRSLCLIPLDAFTTWKLELERYGLYNEDPNKTTIFLYDSDKANKKHFDHLNSSTFGEEDQLLVVCKDGMAFNVMERVFTPNGYKNSNATLIVDEGHLKKIHLLNYVQPFVDPDTKKAGYFNREILMSGSVINSRLIAFDAAAGRGERGHYTLDHIIDCPITNPVPDTRWFFHIMDEGVYGDDVTEFLKNTIAELDPTHTVISSSMANYASLKDSGIVKKLTNKNAKYAYELRGKATAPIENFNNASDSKRACLHIDEKKVKGLNLIADTMIIFTNEKQIDGIFQTIGRVLRPTNPVEVVNVIVICNNNRFFYRSLYVKAFGFEAWEYDPDMKTSESTVAKSCTLISALGGSSIAISKAELCVLLADYLTLDEAGVDTRYIIEWWKANKDVEGIEPILTEDLIRDIVL